MGAWGERGKRVEPRQRAKAGQWAHGLGQGRRGWTSASAPGLEECLGRSEGRKGFRRVPGAWVGLRHPLQAQGHRGKRTVVEQLGNRPRVVPFSWALPRYC